MQVDLSFLFISSCVVGGDYAIDFIFYRSLINNPIYIYICVCVVCILALLKVDTGDILELTSHFRAGLRKIFTLKKLKNE